MAHTFWHKQVSKPLFPDLLWSKPENKQHAGKLLIIGGHAHGFAAPAQAYTIAEKTGIGIARVLLPDHLRSQLTKLQGNTLAAEFAPSTPSGGFATLAVAEMLGASAWADGVLLAGDFGRNSETAVVLEKLVSKNSGIMTATKDAVEYFLNAPAAVIDRANTCFVLTMAQLQKLATSAKFSHAITFGMDLLQLVDTLHEFTTKHRLHIIVKHHATILVAVNGQVSTTATKLGPEDSWRVVTASAAAVWWLQNPNKPYEALTTAVYEATNKL